MKQIPEHYVHTRATPFWTKDSAPHALLRPHSTKAGVCGRISVMRGAVTLLALPSADAAQPDNTILITAGTFAIAEPQHWQRLEIVEADTYFNLDFFSDPKVKLEGAGLSKVLNTHAENELMP